MDGTHVSEHRTYSLHRLLRFVIDLLGRIIYIDSDYEDLDLDISFDISNYSLKSDSLQICTLDNGRIVMLDTYIEDNKISATIKKGYVFVMDIVRYVDTILGYKKDNYK